MSESANLSGLRAVVTGATSGLGAAMADALLEAGATVGTAARPGPRLDEAVARRTQRGLAAQAMALEVRDPASVETAAQALVSRWGGLDMVVNNAGIGMRTVNPRFFDDPRPFFEVSPEVLVPYRPFFGSIRASAGHVHPHRSRDDEVWTSREPRSVGSAHG